MTPRGKIENLIRTWESLHLFNETMIAAAPGLGPLLKGPQGVLRRCIDELKNTQIAS